MADRVAELERLLAEERASRIVAEARAEERAASLEDLRGALEAMQRALPTGSTPVAPAATPDRPRSSWWRRG